jgi:hypothetical protein
MATIKLHLLTGGNTDFGTESCDYRGKGEQGAGEADQHKTIMEREFGPEVETNADIEEVIRDGPKLNSMLKRLVSPIITNGGPSLTLGLRLGVWDE